MEAAINLKRNIVKHRAPVTVATKRIIPIKQSPWARSRNAVTLVILKITGGNYVTNIKNQNSHIRVSIKRPTAIPVI